MTQKVVLKSPLRKLCAVLMTLAITALVMPAFGKTTEEDIQAIYEKMPKLDEQFQQVSNDFYKSYVKTGAVSAFADIKQLPENIAAVPPERRIDLIAGVKKNTQGICKQYADNKFLTLIDLLYSVNETATLRTISDCINQKADAVARAENYFQLAQYYYHRKQWVGALAALKKVNLKDLSVRDAHYADLLHGFVLQSQKQHREAAKIYKLVPPSSPYYAHAKLNEGIGYLRQGWWTEAHLEFKKAIESIQTQQNQEFKNRILVVLAYSQLNYEFYRDARETLRNVSLDSQYTNKALMGLGLAAAYQEDYAGAINAFTRLANNTSPDLSVDESYLLVPTTLQELGDDTAAAEAYLKAIEYYKNRIQTLTNARAKLNSSASAKAPEILEQMDAQADALYGAKNLIPEYIVSNYQYLQVFSRKTSDKALLKKIQSLEAEYDEVLKALVTNNIALRETILNNYLSQAKYGVAKLYDRP